MDYQTQMALIANDLDSLFLRIEALPAHEKLTDAGTAAQSARDLVRAAAVDLHQREMRSRFRGDE